jgi:DNA-binding NtrC family response regulator
MKARSTDPIHALLFGLSEDLAGDLLRPLAKFCKNIQSIKGGQEPETLSAVADSQAQIIFCGANTDVVTKLRQTKPEAPIVVVSRHPEVSGWLDSIEAGASDYCAAPFESAQLQWILETSMRSPRTSA